MYITLCCCFLMSGTTFFLYPTACIIFGLTYLSDKFLLLKYHQKSKTFNDKYHMATFYKYVVLAALCHIFGSVWGFYKYN